MFSSMNPIVRVENLSKQYTIGTRDAAYDTLRESLVEAMRAPFKRLRNGKRNGETILALKNVSFTVEPGEVVGIIGRNGAGKSTLLKVLSRITEPTTGRAELYGRVASLLEVGTGFHAELTGRENTYLNGAILGMKKAEIDRKFDQIVAFADLEKFLDTPVKRYSSGMYMRLAFAVASHLEPEIMVVDEVLAVGDAAFQKKCLGKMENVAQEGRTVLFVSHNMVAVQSLCKRVLWLDHGEIVEDGKAVGVVSSYLNNAFGDGSLLEEAWPDAANAPGNDVARLRRISVRPQTGPSDDPLTMRTPFLIEVEYWNLVPEARLHITLHLYTEHEILAFTTGSGIDQEWAGRPMPAGLYRSVCHVPGELLNVGRHRFKVLVIKDLRTVLFQHESAVTFEILDLDERELSQYGREPGVVKPTLKWKTEQI
ncbi:MAG TPA: polysaccharide ABC transporter ATP-binding protein [Pyrinomonadaceae bacterium]|nr:polysaccharide ABC transporter ATP-binding protein [Pyrinomonadaceae bacterium]